MRGRVGSWTCELTDAQLVMMSAAAQREDRCLAAPERMKGAVVGKRRPARRSLALPANPRKAWNAALASRRNRAELCA